MANTPWGKSQHSQKIERGLAFHTTSGHGGFLVSKGYAEKHLSAAALKKALKWGNYYAFEEDCLAAIVEFEVPASRRSLSISDHDLIRQISRWYPDYLIERDIEPEAEGYAKWLERQEDTRLRSERSPDLITAAQYESETVTRVWTADGSEHLVTRESYDNRSSLNLLSKCQIVVRKCQLYA